MSSPAPPQAESIRQLLLAAFGDAESTIRATDTKASIALVVHGFIFAGVLGVLADIGPWFNEASCVFRVGLVGLVGLTAVSFIVSVVQILRCVAPAPAAAVPKVSLQDVFYLPGRAGAVRGVAHGTPTLRQLRTKVAMLDDAQIADELMGELIKVSAIRARKVSLAQAGLMTLGVEIGLSVILLCLIGAHQL
jgi:hypothetical protein